MAAAPRSVRWYIEGLSAVGVVSFVRPSPHGGVAGTTGEASPEVNRTAGHKRPGPRPRTCAHARKRPASPSGQDFGRRALAADRDVEGGAVPVSVGEGDRGYRSPRDGG